MTFIYPTVFGENNCGFDDNYVVSHGPHITQWILENTDKECNIIRFYCFLQAWHNTVNIKLQQRVWLFLLHQQRNPKNCWNNNCLTRRKKNEVETTTTITTAAVSKNIATKKKTESSNHNYAIMNRIIATFGGAHHNVLAETTRLWCCCWLTNLHPHFQHDDDDDYNSNDKQKHCSITTTAFSNTTASRNKIHVFAPYVPLLKKRTRMLQRIINITTTRICIHCISYWQNTTNYWYENQKWKYLTSVRYRCW